MEERVYIETSVIGAYFDERNDVVSPAQRYWTSLWWDGVRSRYEVFISKAVTDELSHPDFPHSEEALALVSGIQAVPIVEEVRQIVRSYIQNRIMPANPNKFRQIRMCNISMGLYVPYLVTPNQLIGE